MVNHPSTTTAGRRLLGLPPLRIGGITLPNPIVLAPMAGVSEAPYRTLCLRMGAGFAPTELVSSKGLEFQNRRTQAYLRHDPAAEPHLSVQIYGGDPETMAKAAVMAAEHGAKIIDLNMGCPVKKVTRNGAGSALLTDPERAANIVRSIRARLGERIPVTAKIRSGWDDQSRNAADVGRRLEDAGLAAIALHPRTRAQGYAGRADWSQIRALKQAVSIPVIANGDLTSADDADRVLAETGADAVMIGRAALGNPFVFRALAAAHAGRARPPAPTASERAKVVRAHLEAHLEHLGDELQAVRKFRQHLIWYSRGLTQAAAFRGKVVTLDRAEEVFEAIEGYFSSAEKAVEEAAQYDERAAFG